MKVYFVKDYEELSKKAFEILEKTILENSTPVISLNTGGTPRGLFKELVKGIHGGLDISHTTLLTLDEYVGPVDAVYSVQRYIKENLLDKIPTQFMNVRLIHGEASDKVEEVKRYKDVLKKYPRDIQLLGLGTNGHIGANEPGTSFDSEMFIAKHKESTIESTMKEYGLKREETPSEMLTLGFREIREAKQILLLISGKHKAQAVKDFLEGDVTVDCPVTGLRNHENLTVIIDEEAASLLTKEL